MAGIRAVRHDLRSGGCDAANQVPGTCPGRAARASGLRLREDAHAAELGAAAAAKLVAGGLVELVERLDERSLEEARCLVVVGLRPAGGLRDDGVDHAEVEAVER